MIESANSHTKESGLKSLLDPYLRTPLSNSMPGSPWCLSSQTRNRSAMPFFLRYADEFGIPLPVGPRFLQGESPARRTPPGRRRDEVRIAASGVEHLERGALLVLTGELDQLGFEFEGRECCSSAISSREMCLMVTCGPSGLCGSRLSRC